MKKIIILILSVMLLATLTIAVSAEQIEYFYINSETGDDHYSGYDADNALKTFTQACRLAEKSGADKAYLVITNEYECPKSVGEIEHTVPFVVTAHDGKTDFGATNGAKLVFGTGLRYVLRGDTTFENITIEYTKSLNCVAQYNHITFGDNVVTKRLDAEKSGIYIVGGWQSPASNAVTNLDSHITIKSGSFLYVIGGCRQKPASEDILTLTGTHYIDIQGGNIENLLGASAQSHYSNSAVITMSGGYVNIFNVGGDVTRRLNGDATVTLTGGEIAALNVNNVVGNGTVNLLGTKVGTMSVSYASSEISSLKNKAKSTKTLIYDANYYTNAEIDAFSGFDTKKNNAVLFVKDGGTGNGISESTPTSYENALKIAAENKAVVTVIGKLTLDNFTELVHENSITVTGKDSGSSIEVKGTYTLGGETVFDNIKINGNFNAENGMLATTEAATANINVVGNATLAAGNIGTVTNAKKVIVSGATVGTIVGGSDSASIEIHGGKVGTVKSTDATINDFKLTVSGGTVEKVVFNNITKSLSYTLLGGEVKAYEVNGNNVNGSLAMNEQLFTKDSLGTAAALFTEVGEKVFFLADGGEGSGASVSSPASSLDAAYAAIGESGGTIVICAPFTVATAFNTSTNNGKITFTSVYDGVDYAKTNDAKMIFSANFYCGGDTEFNNITMKSNANYRTIFANCHEVVFGEGIVSYPDSTNTYVSVMGGSQKALDGESTNLTISSGIWQRVRGGSSTDGNKNATVNITVNGGEFKEMLTLGSSASHEGVINATINGGLFRSGIYAATLSKDTHTFNCEVNIVINGGTFYRSIAPANSDVGTYSGTYNLTLNGGDFSYINDIKGTEGISGMTSTLSVRESVNLDKEISGTQSFTSLVRTNSADPWLFFHDGFYYYIATAGGNGLQLVKAANLGDIVNSTSTRIYKPEKGHEYSSHLWSPEIHYFSAEEIGEEYAGWYCFLSSQPDDTWKEANKDTYKPSGFGEQRAYVIKCLTDDLLGPWGHPVTGEPNVPQKLIFPDSGHNENEFTAGCSVITINGVKYLTFISEVGRETQKTDDFNFYQTINIVKFTNPWTVTGQPKVICKPEYDWEKKGSEDKYHPAVVEGATAVYNPNGEVYIIYSGSGYWTSHYQLGQLTYIGGENGDPTDINNWKKKPTSIFSKSDELRGCGHASYVTDTDGQGWICYHAYPKGDDGRSAYIEPYYFTEEGVVIGNGSGHPAPVDTIYTTNVNPLPIAKRIGGFDNMSTVAATTVKLTIGSTTAYINSEVQTLDAAPINRNNRTMLPVRFLANAFGVSNDGIKWDAQTRTATLTNATTTIVVTIDAPTMTVNGETVALDSPAIIESNRTYLPVRAIANALGVSNDNIAWDAATNTATLVK